MPNRPDPDPVLDQLRAGNAGHLEALRHAGDTARRLRADVNRLTGDVRRMVAVLGEVMNSPDVPEPLRTLAREALEGDPDLIPVGRFEGDSA